VITISQQTITLDGHLTMLSTPTIYRQGLQALTAGSWQIDCSQLASVDSSAVALLLAWLRAAQAKNCQLSVSGLPSSLLSLASLYGVDEMLPAQVKS
jgi:phospholipid transport system transporter-binding protein